MKSDLVKEVTNQMKASAIATKQCYFSGCNAKPIKAHSISNKRLLLKLSRDGKVLYFDKETDRVGNLIETGRGVASTFGGFCGDHDKIFLPIDNGDYIPGDKEQEFLFAMRASAKELSTKLIVQHAIAQRLEGVESSNYDINTEGLRIFKAGVDVGVNDLMTIKDIFNDTFKKSKHNVIQTTVVMSDKELPIALSSLFHIELSPDGALINDLSPEGYSKPMKPCFMTVFPQNGKTYCLISYLRKDRNDFKFLEELSNGDENTKQAVISNLITIYTENFVVNPEHWQKLSDTTKKKYTEIYESSMLPRHRNFIFDPDFNLFL